MRFSKLLPERGHQAILQIYNKRSQPKSPFISIKRVILHVLLKQKTPTEGNGNFPQVRSAEQGCS